MNQPVANPSSINKSPLPQASTDASCKHHTRNGRCRMPVADISSSLCSHHARRRQKDTEAADLTATLTSGLTEFKSAIPINDFLSRLLLLEAQDRIPPRRAAVMAYTCNLLLRTLPAIDREINPQDDEPQQIIFDMPRPKRDWPTPEPEPKIFSGISGVTPMPEKKSS
jgi:hypothetical protein